MAATIAKSDDNELPRDSVTIYNEVSCCRSCCFVELDFLLKVEFL
jgi:hypothetical protein